MLRPVLLVAILLGPILLGPVLLRTVPAILVIAVLVAAVLVAARLVDARRIGPARFVGAVALGAVAFVALAFAALAFAALAFAAVRLTLLRAGGVAAVVVIARTLVGGPVVLAVGALAVGALTLVALPFGALTLVALPVVALPLVGLTIILALVAGGGFRGFHQTGLVIALRVDHVVTRQIGLIVITLVPVVRAVFGAILTPLLAPVVRRATLRDVLDAVTRLGVGIGVLTTLAAIGLLAGFLFSGHLAVRLGQKPGVMFGVLQKVLGGDAVIRQLRVTGEELIFLDQLGRGATHLAIRARTVEHAVDDVAERARAGRLRTRTRLGRAHVVL